MCMFRLVWLSMLLEISVIVTSVLLWVDVVYVVGFNCVSWDVLVFRSVGVMSIGVIGIALLIYVEGMAEVSVYDCVVV
jgi:hypothetical protein